MTEKWNVFLWHFERISAMQHHFIFYSLTLSFSSKRHCKFVIIIITTTAAIIINNNNIRNIILCCDGNKGCMPEIVSEI